MKLLTKSEIVLESNQQKKTEIDQGIHLAKKIDALRESLANLQKERSDFIKGNKQELDSSIKTRLEIKESLENEIKILEEKRKMLLVPLDEEWSKIRSESEVLEKEERELAIKKEVILRTENELIARSQASEIALQDMFILREEQSLIRDNIRLLERQKQGELYEIQQERIRSQKEHDERITALKDKERRLDYDSKHFKDFEKNLKKKEKELILRERKLIGK